MPTDDDLRWHSPEFLEAQETLNKAREQIRKWSQHPDSSFAREQVEMWRRLERLNRWVEPGAS